MIDSDISSLLNNQRMHGPFPAPPLEAFRCSPLGTVSRKRKPGKLRVINHLSWPPGTSVNDGIPDTKGHITYESFGCAVAEIAQLGRGTLLAKLDLKDAFRHIPIRAHDWHLLGCRWNDSFYYYVVLVFGLKSAPYIFNLFAEALHWIIQRHIPAALKHYLDDFLTLFRPGTPLPHANAAIDWILGLGDSLGLFFQHEKTARPCTALEFLGLELDTDAMEARLPSDKLTFLRSLLDEWSYKDRCTLRELQELIGFLQFTAQVIPHSRAFIRRLIDFSCTFRSPHAVRYIPKYARAELTWWRTFMPAWNGVRLITPSRPTIHIYTDASGTKGIGGIFGNHWYASRVPRRFRGMKRDIQFKELYAVVQAMLRWGEEWAHHHVIFHIDNEVIVNAITTERNRSRHTMSLLRMLLMLAACLDISFTASWLPSKSNALADAASRFQYSRLFELAPYLDRKTCSPNPRLIGLKRTLSSHDTSHSTSGMGLHPALEKPTTRDRNHSSTLSASTPAFSMPTAPSSPPLSTQLWSGLPILEVGGCSQKPLNPTCAPFAPCMSTLTSRSTSARHRSSSGSSAGSNGTMASATATRSSPSHSTSSNVFARQCQTRRHLQTPPSSQL